jgi:hypothetical protein
MGVLCGSLCFDVGGGGKNAQFFKKVVGMVQKSKNHRGKTAFFRSKRSVWL